MTNTNMIKGIIASRGMTQNDLASKAEMSVSALNSKINNKAYFDTREIDVICTVLGIDDIVTKAQVFLCPECLNNETDKAATA